jgi:hypothetical protein
MAAVRIVKFLRARYSRTEEGGPSSAPNGNADGGGSYAPLSTQSSHGGQHVTELQTFPSAGTGVVVGAPGKPVVVQNASLVNAQTGQVLPVSTVTML